MKNTWEKLGNDIETLKGEIETLLEMVPLSTKFHKQSSTINKAWNRFNHSLKAMNAFVTPVKSVDISCPLLKDANFSASWKFWKDYLIEQHGINLRSRTELMQLKQMMKITEGKPDIAVAFLEYAMYRNTKSFFKVNETEIPQATTTKKDSNKKMVVSLPSKYKQLTLEEAIENEQKALQQPTG